MAELASASTQARVVLVPNPFYRSKKAPVVTGAFDFNKPEDRQLVFGFRAAMTDAGIDNDAKAFIAFLDDDEAAPTPSLPNEATTARPTTAGVGEAGVFRACSAAVRATANSSTSWRSSPVRRSAASTRRLAPLPDAAGTAVVTQTLPPATTGDDQPLPGSGAFQATFFSSDQVVGSAPVGGLIGGTPRTAGMPISVDAGFALSGFGRAARPDSGGGAGTAGGDATGAALVRALRAKAQTASHIQWRGGVEVDAMLLHGDRVAGVRTRDARGRVLGIPGRQQREREGVDVGQGGQREVGQERQPPDGQHA